jgi:hypothetical protein
MMSFLEYLQKAHGIQEMWNSKGKSETGKSLFVNPPSASRPKPRDVEPKPSTNRQPKPRDVKRCGSGGGVGRC